MAKASAAQILNQQEKPIAVFTDRSYRKKRNALWWLGIAILFLLAELAYWAYGQFLPRIQNFGISILWINEKLYLTLMPVLAIFALCLIILNWPVRRRSVQVFSDGIKFKHRRKTQELVWKQITSIALDFSQSSFLGIKGKSRKFLKFAASSGNERIIIDNRYDRFDDLVTTVRLISFPILLEKTQHQLKNSSAISFGKVSFEPAKGLFIRGKWIPLSEIKQAGITNGWFTIQLADSSTKRVLTRQINNPDILMQVLNDYCPTCSER